MGKYQKFKVTATGKVVKVKAVGRLEYEDVKTGERYDIGDLQIIPEKHSVAWGTHVGRFGVYLFAREYFKYKTFQFGISFDLIKGADRAIDVELKFACFGAGVRFIILTKK